MKRNSSAHSTVRIIVGCLAIAGLVALEVAVGKSLVSRIDGVTTIRPNVPQAPSMDMSDLLAVH
jgi:hypothetical protein